MLAKRVHGSIYLKRGCKIVAHDRVRLRFGDYVDRSKLPTVPKKFGHLIAAAPPGGWGILGNDQYGCCVMAGAAHEHMLWAWATKRPIPPFTTAGVVEQYLERTGGSDDGLDPVAIAGWRQRTGIKDAQGVSHKIDAYARISSLDDLDLAVYLFGIAAFCWRLPDNAEDQFGAEHIWDDTSKPPDDNNGHYTPIGGKNSVGNYQFLTWGRIQAATPAYTAKYMDAGGCLAYLSQEYLLATGASPEAIRWGDLAIDLHMLTA